MIVCRYPGKCEREAMPSSLHCFLHQPLEHNGKSYYGNEERGYYLYVPSDQKVEDSWEEIQKLLDEIGTSGFFLWGREQQELSRRLGGLGKRALKDLILRLFVEKKDAETVLKNLGYEKRRGSWELPRRQE